jgi:GT2 family glycosyltransferase
MKMAVDSITVIVNHYNRPDFVYDAVSSARNQTVMPNAEILVVDDCSRPENREKLKGLENIATILTMPRNSGVAAARNFGARQAKGQWLTFLDDDDLFLPDKRERQVRYLNAHPEVVALGGGLTMLRPDGREEYWGGKPTRKLTVADALLYTASMAQSLMIRRDVFLELGGFDVRLRYLEDYEFGIRLLASGAETHFLAEPLFIYRLGGRQQGTFQRGKMFWSELRVLNMHAGLVRREFGPLGLIRLKARCCRKHGVRRGRLLGRSFWAWGCALDAIFGRLRGEFDE